MYQELLSDARFFELLRRIDVELAGETRLAGCDCGGVLHSARYRRKPRGGPPGLSRECAVRESFCCAEEGCRRRATPPSVRFLGRKVFFSVAVVLVPLLRDGMTPARFRRLRQQLPVSRRTVQRWRRWWGQLFALGRRWRQRADAELLVVGETLWPGSLLSAFSAVREGPERTLAVLRWLADGVAGGQAR